MTLLNLEFFDPKEKEPPLNDINESKTIVWLLLKTKSTATYIPNYFIGYYTTLDIQPNPKSPAIIQNVITTAEGYVGLNQIDFWAILPRSF